MKSQTSKKVIASVLSAGLAFSMIGSVVYAVNNHQENSNKAASTVEDSNAPCKDETVYVLANADGSVNKVIVNDWLKNTQKTDTIKDKSTLSDIENVKGDESYVAGQDNSLVWDAKGEDIYYQGTTKEKLPVQMSVQYRLDGKKISPENLAGKSGKLTIRFDYKNTEFEKVKVGGKNRKIYVPFTMMTGMMLDANTCKNITVSNGKIANMGDQVAVIGVAFPGMQNNLNVSKNDLDIPDYVEITADVTDFEMSETMTFATSDLLADFDTDKLDLDELTDSMGKLKSGMTKLMDGSDKLYDGLCELLKQSKTLVDGVDKLTAGATSLNAGANSLNSGASQLKNGAEQLSKGLTQLDSNSDSLNSGAKQVFQTLLSAANDQLKAAGLSVPKLTIGNYASVLNGVIGSLDENAVYQKVLKQVTAEVNNHRGEIKEAVTKAVREQVYNEVTAQVTEKTRETILEEVRKNETKFRAEVIAQALGMTLEEYNAAVEAGQIPQEQQDAINSAVEAAMQAKTDEQMESKQVQAQIKELSEKTTEEKMNSSEIKAVIETNTDNAVQKKISETMASDEIQAQLKAAAEGAKAVIALKTSLDSYDGFYRGLKTYTAGVSSALSGANQLRSGLDTLKSGTSDLCKGTEQLSKGTQEMKGKAPALIDGITQLRDGSKALSDGLTTFMEDGIQKLLDVADGDLVDLSDRISASVDVAKQYTSFTGVEDNTKGSVKFIYKTNAIETKD